MKIYIVSLGCSKNLTDTEVLMGKLVCSGHEITNDPSQAEMIIVNTCAFLKPARDEAYETIEEMAEWKKKGKCKKLYLAGCFPKWNRDVQSQVPLPDEIDGIIDSIKLYSGRDPRIKATPPWYAYVKIAEGCNNKCSYCLIPKIRGHLRNRKVSDLLKEVKGLAKRGAKEIIYVAQDTTAHPNFPVLLRKTAGIKNIRWIRIMYAHPAHLTDELIETIAAEKKIVKYLDLPIQHACDNILKKMNRRYQRLDLFNLISKIRRRIPDIALRTSVLVGFPGEGEAEFKELYDFIKEVKFERLGVFTYWKEEGTPAAKMRGQVSERLKKQRFQKLMRLGTRIARERNNTLIGKTLESMIEGARRGYYVGRTFMDAPDIDGQVFIKKSRSLKPGEIKDVRITKARTHDLTGCLT